MLRNAATAALVAALQAGQGQLITGRVISDTGAPLPNARLSVPNPDSEAPTVVLSDRDGRFAVRPPSLPTTISCAKTGYGLQQLRATTSNETLECRLAAAAVISGRVVDEDGDPVAGARVGVEPTSQRIETDDRGEYRIGGLPAGTYTVVVGTFGIPTQDPNRRPGVVMPGLNTVYYRASPTREAAQPITLKAGEHVDSIDFLIPVAQSGSQSFSVMPGLAVYAPAAVPPMRPEASGAISGIVRSSDGRALPYALVLLRGSTLMERPALVQTSSAGRFEFRNVVAGQYQLTASKAGHFPSQTAPLRIALKDGEARENSDIALRRWAVVTGRVLDELGDPVQGARVLLLQLRYENGRRQLIGGRSAISDDQGNYRIFAADRGNYVVSATIGGVFAANVPCYALAYYPGTTNASQAHFVSLRDGEELGSIDSALTRGRTATVRGTIIGPDGQPTMGGSVNLMPSQRSASPLALSVGARLQANGAFEFPNLPPGEYVIQAYGGRKNRSTEGDFGALVVTVADRDVDNLVLRMSKGARLLGRLRFDTRDPNRQPNLSQVELTAVPADFDLSPPSNWATADFSSDGSFELVGLSGVRRLQVIRTPPGWALKEVRVNGADATDRRISFGTTTSVSDAEVVLTDRIGALSGRVTGDDGRPAAGASVMAFSSDRTRWYDTSRFLRVAKSAEDGSYSIEGLPFGSYYTVAVTELPADGADAWQEPAFLERAARRASSVTIRDGERSTVGLRRVAP